MAGLVTRFAAFVIGMESEARSCPEQMSYALLTTWQEHLRGCEQQITLDHLLHGMCRSRHSTISMMTSSTL
eukprot:711466-Amphidinium_carterae.1